MFVPLEATSPCPVARVTLDSYTRHILSNIRLAYGTRDWSLCSRHDVNNQSVNAVASTKQETHVTFKLFDFFNILLRFSTGEVTCERFKKEK
jgi:hypothetical protein